MKDQGRKAVDNRISITVHLRPREAALVDAAVARARTTRHELARDLLLSRASESAPILACLAKLITIHHRLQDARLLDDEMRVEIVTAVRELAVVARAEVAG